tara:strand:- start:809 stop:1282 length:474 start_codon:yes stop_codon:yes gene_type:complete
MAENSMENEMDFLNAPQFPGQIKGVPSIDQVRKLIRRQKRVKGFSFEAPVGNSSFNIQLSGTARLWLGLIMYGIPKTDEPQPAQNCCTTFINITSMQLMINNEIVIDQLDPNIISFGAQDESYYFIPRPLSGTDEITVNFTNTGTATETAKIGVYYI